MEGVHGRSSRLPDYLHGEQERLTNSARSFRPVRGRFEKAALGCDAKTDHVRARKNSLHDTVHFSPV